MPVLMARWRGGMVEFRVVISDGVVPRRVIFLVRRVESTRGVVVKGGLRRPVLGVIMYFWWVGGMERVVWMVVERSAVVAVAGKV